MRDMTHCDGSDLCSELAGASDTDFSRTYLGDPPSRVLGGTRHLSVLADLSPLTVGHLLLVPREHHLSFANVVHAYGAEVEHVASVLLPRYREVFGEPTVLEHGSSPEMRGSACVNHAHWHLLPIPGDQAAAIMARDGLSLAKLKDIKDLAAAGRRYIPYFFCLYRDQCLFAPADRRLRRQYLRSVAGEVLGIPDPSWDWSVVVRKDALRVTVKRASDPPVASRLAIERLPTLHSDECN
jgi:diadenosine tetraphosphate (Ap4A) HIT family hydrolase